MQRLAELKPLLEQQPAHAVSVYIPLHNAAETWQENEIHLKNLLRSATRKLGEAGCTERQYETILAPLKKLLKGGALEWREHHPGVAMFMWEQGHHMVPLPQRPQPQAIVSARFHIKPLLPMLDDRPFYVLGLDQQTARLWRGTRYEMKELDISAVLDEIPFPEDTEFIGSIQFHTGTSGQNAMYHGHGDTGEKAKKLEQTYRLLDRALQPIIQNDPAPVLMAGVKTTLSFFAGLSTNPYLLDDQTLHLEQGRGMDESLHEQAWHLIAPRLMQEQQEAAKSYKRSASEGLASSKLEEVLPAATHGRNEVLFVATDEQRWGAYEEESNVLELSEAPQGDNEDLLNLAALQTLRHGGMVYTMPKAEMPGESGCAAVFRYPDLSTSTAAEPA